MFRELLFPGIEEILMCLQEIFFEFVYEDARYPVDDRIPGVFGGEKSRNDVIVFFLEGGYFEWFS